MSEQTSTTEITKLNDYTSHELSYDPTKWVNGREPALNANNLNKIEDAIDHLAEYVTEDSKTLINIVPTVNEVVTELNEHTVKIYGANGDKGLIEQTADLNSTVFGSDDELSEGLVETVKYIKLTLDGDEEHDGLITNVTNLSNQVDIINGTESEDGSIAKALAYAKSYADTKGTALHTTISKEIDDDVDAAKTALQSNIDKKVSLTNYDAKMTLLENADAALNVRVNDIEEMLENVSNVMDFRGAVDAVPADGTSDYQKGDVVIVTSGTDAGKEYVYDGSTWHEFGFADANATAINKLQQDVEAINEAIANSELVIEVTIGSDNTISSCSHTYNSINTEHSSGKSSYVKLTDSEGTVYILPLISHVADDYFMYSTLDTTATFYHCFKIPSTNRHEYYIDNIISDEELTQAVEQAIAEIDLSAVVQHVDTWTVENKRLTLNLNWE